MAVSLSHRPSVRTRRDERGVSAILFALLLTGILMMSAIAVDLGSAFTERRHDQNTADAAAMSAAVESVLGGGVIDEVVAEVRAKVDTTLGITTTDADWENCVDDAPLHYTARQLAAANPLVDPVTDCISFSIGFDRVRVQLPEQEVNMIFAPSVGLPQLQTSASAEAAIVNGAGTGSPPFVALSTATTGDFICLRTSQKNATSKIPDPLPNGNGPTAAPTVGSRLDPCDPNAFANSSDHFGTLSPFRYQDGCSQQKADEEVAISIGIDHIMGYFPDGFSGTPGVVNTDDRVDGGGGCKTAFPNTFEVGQGFNAQGLRCALISLDSSSAADKSLCNGVQPRLKQGDYIDNVNTFAGEPLDNVAPWRFMRDAIDLWTGEKDANGNYVIDPYPNTASRPYCLAAATFRDDDDTFDPSSSPGVPDYDDYYDDYYDPVTGASVPTKGDHRLEDADWDYYDLYDAFTACLQLWDSTAGDPQLFTTDVGVTPRFAFIPQVAEDNLAVSYVHIEAFLPTFIYRIYQETTSSGASACSPTDPRTDVTYFLHDAGQDDLGACGSSGQNVDRVASIIFACGMLPDALCNKDTGLPENAGQDIYEFRLAK